MKNACIRSGLDLKYLRGICTDDAPAMTGNQHGFITRFLDYVCNEYDNKELIHLHCQEAPCAKSVALSTILKDVNRIILFIVVVVVVYPTLSHGWGHEGRPWSPRSWATPQGLDQRSYRDRELPKNERCKGSVAGQCRMR